MSPNSQYKLSDFDVIASKDENEICHVVAAMDRREGSTIDITDAKALAPEAEEEPPEQSPEGGGSPAGAEGEAGADAAVAEGGTVSPRNLDFEEFLSFVENKGDGPAPAATAAAPTEEEEGGEEEADEPAKAAAPAEEVGGAGGAEREAEREEKANEPAATGGSVQEGGEVHDGDGKAVAETARNEDDAFYIGLVDSVDQQEGNSAEASNDEGAPSLSQNKKLDETVHSEESDLTEEEAAAPTDNEDAPSPSAGSSVDEVLAAVEEDVRGEGNSKGEEILDHDELSAPGFDPSQRRLSNEKRVLIHKASNSMHDSVNTEDSWGGVKGSLPPLMSAKRHTMPEPPTTSSSLLKGEGSDEEKLDNCHANPSPPEEGDQSPPPPQASSTPPQDKASNKSNVGPEVEPPVLMHRATWSAGDNTGAIEEDGAQFINFNKLLRPSSSEYYYSSANRSNRQLLDKVKSKKNLSADPSIDESHGSRASMMTSLARAASYRGPPQRKKDGSSIKSALRRTSRKDSETAFSLDSAEGSNGLPKVALKRCSFSSVDVREHDRVAGDNPCVTSGVPLSIGWGYYQHDPIDLDVYEDNKGEPRDKIEMMVPAGVRRQMLRDEFKVSINEINAAMKDVNVTKRNRRHTVASEHMEGWSEVSQSAKRKLKRFLKKTSTEKEQQKIWEEAQKAAAKKYPKGTGGNNAEASGVGSKGQKVGPNNAPPSEITF
ncbi:hypothetical protein ACHAWF_013365 [Thalassiosira exigua]